MYSTKQVAEKLGVTRQAVYQWVKANTIESVREWHGTRQVIRISEDAITKFKLARQN